MTTVDPITRAIIKNALASAADEMAVGLYRTAYSTIVRDVLDFSTSLCDAAGTQIAQGTTIPFHMGAVPSAMETLLQKFEGDIEPGDVFIMNDPFGGGMHTPDIFIVKPIFAEDRRIAFAVATAHHLDLGGRIPGTSACDNTDIFQEGLRIPWLKLYRRGQPDDSLFALFQTNVRVPHMTLGDLRAQMSACHTGEQALQQLVGRYGLETFEACTRELLDYTERLIRAQIATWPDGESSFTDYMDSDGCGGPRVKIQCTITVAGDHLTVDFTGSAPQVRGSLNCTESFTASVVYLCVRAVMREDIPNTAGMFRPIKVIAPSGTVLNGKLPAASSMRGVTGFRTADVVFGALAQIVPAQVKAAGEGGNSLVIIGGLRRETDEAYVYYELISGTWGARPDRDGNDGLCNPCNVAANISVEEAESNYPVRINRYGLVQDSGGAGKFRGGMAIHREWKLLEGEATLTIRSDRRDHPPYGLAGGLPGKGSVNILRQADREETLPTMVSQPMHEGEVFYHRQPGGGGFGTPLERDQQAVVRDVRDERISREAAREEFGVVLDRLTLQVDQAATDALRGGNNA